jgi:hypothetical protein
VAANAGKGAAMTRRGRIGGTQMLSEQVGPFNAAAARCTHTHASTAEPICNTFLVLTFGLVRPLPPPPPTRACSRRLNSQFIPKTFPAAAAPAAAG